MALPTKEELKTKKETIDEQLKILDDKINSLYQEREELLRQKEKIDALINYLENPIL